MTSQKQERHIEKLFEAANQAGLQIIIKPAEKPTSRDWANKLWYDYTVCVKA